MSDKIDVVGRLAFIFTSAEQIVRSVELEAKSSGAYVTIDISSTATTKKSYLAKETQNSVITYYKQLFDEIIRLGQIDEYWKATSFYEKNEIVKVDALKLNNVTSMECVRLALGAAENLALAQKTPTFFDIWALKYIVMKNFVVDSTVDVVIGDLLGYLQKDIQHAAKLAVLGFAYKSGEEEKTLVKWIQIFCEYEYGKYILYNLLVVNSPVKVDMSNLVSNIESAKDIFVMMKQIQIDDYSKISDTTVFQAILKDFETKLKELVAVGKPGNNMVSEFAVSILQPLYLRLCSLRASESEKGPFASFLVTNQSVFDQYGGIFLLGPAMEQISRTIVINMINAGKASKHILIDKLKFGDTVETIARYIVSNGRLRAGSDVDKLITEYEASLDIFFTKFVSKESVLNSLIYTLYLGRIALCTVKNTSASDDVLSKEIELNASKLVSATEKVADIHTKVNANFFEKSKKLIKKDLTVISMMLVPIILEVKTTSIPFAVASENILDSTEKSNIKHTAGDKDIISKKENIDAFVAVFRLGITKHPRSFDSSVIKDPLKSLEILSTAAVSEKKREPLDLHQTLSDSPSLNSESTSKLTLDTKKKLDLPGIIGNGNEVDW